MRSSPSLLLTTFFSVLLFSASVTCQADTDKKADWTRIEKYIGCFKSPGDGKLEKKDVGQSQGACRVLCQKGKRKYAATTNAEFCYCSDKLPQESEKVDNDLCDQPCKGYPFEPCGSRAGHYTIFLADTSQSDPRLYDGSGQTGNPMESLIPSSTTPPAATSTDNKGQIVTVTASQAPPTDENKPKSGINKAGAAAGAVVGVLVAIAIGVGAFVFIRKQRRKKVEEEYRRSAAVREFHKKPEADLRLDPVMLQRRASDGSIADNQDYSRRILKVTNPE
jgi:cell wall integrity and stress response component